MNILEPCFHLSWPGSLLIWHSLNINYVIWPWAHWFWLHFVKELRGWSLDILGGGVPCNWHLSGGFPVVGFPHLPCVIWTICELLIDLIDTQPLSEAIYITSFYMCFISCMCYQLKACSHPCIMDYCIAGLEEGHLMPKESLHTTTWNEKNISLLPWDLWNISCHQNEYLVTPCRGYLMVGWPQPLGVKDPYHSTYYTSY